MWYMEDKKSKHEIFYFSPEPLFWFYLTNTWFFLISNTSQEFVENMF